MEPVRDSLERLIYRTEQLSEKLVNEEVKLPIWTWLTVERALELAKENHDSLDEDKEAVLDKVRDVWYANPQLRFGQLVMNLESAHNQDVYYIQDREIIERLGKTYG